MASAARSPRVFSCSLCRCFSINAAILRSTIRAIREPLDCILEVENQVLKAELLARLCRFSRETKELHWISQGCGDSLATVRTSSLCLSALPRLHPIPLAPNVLLSRVLQSNVVCQPF